MYLSLENVLLLNVAVALIITYRLIVKSVENRRRILQLFRCFQETTTALSLSLSSSVLHVCSRSIALCRFSFETSEQHMHRVPTYTRDRLCTLVTNGNSTLRDTFFCLHNTNSPPVQPWPYTYLLCSSSY
jgi:hypothetical protein